VGSPAGSAIASIRIESEVLSAVVAHLREHCLDAPGLFRVTGDRETVRRICSSFSSEPRVLHLVGSPFEVADALKLYLRSASVAVVPATVFDSWMASRRLPMSATPELADLHALVRLLEEPALQALRTLLQLLCDLAARSGANQLTPAALGVLLANTIIGNSEEVPDPTLMLYRNKVLEALITLHPESVKLS
jgi:hypothetical protein